MKTDSIPIPPMTHHDQTMDFDGKTYIRIETRTVIKAVIGIVLAIIAAMWASYGFLDSKFDQINERIDRNYMHLEEKIGNEAKHLNLRIDSILTTVPQSQDKLNAE